MAGSTEHVGLKLDADSSAWEAAFRQAEVAAGRLGQEVDKTKKKASGLATMKWSDFTTGLNQGIELVSKIAGKVGDLAKFSAEMANLEKRVPVERLRMMQEATEGAVKKTDLMRFSMRAMSGEMHLTERGLETVLKAANTLGDKGFGDTAENAEKLLSALRKGSSRELREFGIALTDTKDKGANVNAMLEKFNQLAAENPPVDETLKLIEATQVAWGDFIDDVMAGLGRFIAETARGIAILTGLMDYSKSEKIQQRAKAQADRYAPGATDLEKGTGHFLGISADITAIGGNDAARAQRIMDYQVASAQALAQSVQDQARLDAIEEAKALVEAALHPKKGGQWEGKLPGGGGAGKRSNLAGRAGTIASDIGRGFAWRGQLAAPGLERFWAPQGVAGAEGAATSFFGGAAQGLGDDPRAAMAELAANLEDQSTAVGAAYATMTSGITAAVDAAITGSENIGKAFMRASAAALKSIAVESAVRALYHTAMAIGSLAFYDVKGAALHGQAAALQAAAALAAGAGAAALGGLAGGGSHVGGRGGGAYSAPGGGYASNRSTGGGGEPSNITVNIHGFVGNSKNDAVAAIAEGLEQATSARRIRSPYRSRTTRFGAEAA